jgi:hypothetical protein
MQYYHSALTILLLALLSACASAPPAATELAATLSFVAGDKPLDRGSGIYSIGNYNLPREPMKVVYIAPGYREIGYNCPGYIFVDNPPTVLHKFLGGKQYELFCDKDGKPVFHVKVPTST